MAPSEEALVFPPARASLEREGLRPQHGLWEAQASACSADPTRAQPPVVTPGRELGGSLNLKINMESKETE